MPFFDIQKLKGRGQPQLGALFIFTIPSIPSLVVGGNSQALEIQCRGVTVPGISNTKIEIPYYGFKVSYNGLMEYSGELTTTFLLMEDKLAYNTVRNWVNLAQSEVTGISALSSAIKTLAIIRGYSVDKETITGEWHFTGVFPTACPDIAFSQGTAELEIDATWSYDTSIRII